MCRQSPEVSISEVDDDIKNFLSPHAARKSAIFLVEPVVVEVLAGPDKCRMAQPAKNATVTMRGSGCR
jgi:hypothetical protein